MLVIDEFGVFHKFAFVYSEYKHNSYRYDNQYSKGYSND